MKLFSQKIASLVFCPLALGLMTLPRSSSAVTPSSMTLPEKTWTVVSSELHGWQPLQATLLSGLIQPHSQRFIQATLTAKNEQTMPARLWKVRGSSRGLFLMLPGTGSDATSNLANALAETINASGYDVFILSNPFSVAFQKSFSSDGLIGFPQKDLPDVEDMLWSALVAYTSQYGSPRKLGLIGYSLGGLYTAMESRPGARIDFDKLIALNPTIDFQYGMDQVDKMMRVQLAQPLTFTRIARDLFSALTATIEGFTVLNLNRLRTVLPGDSFENTQIIGLSFSGSLADVTNNLASTPELSDEAPQIYAASKSITFAKYTSLVGPALRKKGYFAGRSYAQIAKQSDLRRILRSARTGVDIEVIHNADDILVRDTDLHEVHEILGSRLTVFDAGGHCGNFWVPTFKKQLYQLIERR